MNTWPIIPVTLDPQWCEQYGVSLQIGFSLGQWRVDLEWRKVHSYSDDRGSHTETWLVSRSHKLLDVAIALAIKQACAEIERGTQ